MHRFPCLPKPFSGTRRIAIYEIIAFRCHSIGVNLQVSLSSVSSRFPYDVNVGRCPSLMLPITRNIFAIEKRHHFDGQIGQIDGQYLYDELLAQQPY